MNDLSWKKSVDDKELLTVTRGTCKGGTTEGRDYGGVFYSVCFRVDTPICLRELGFFGPSATQQASYFVYVDIFKPRSAGIVMPSVSDYPPIAKRKVDVVAKKDELFYVDLGDGVPVEPGIWHLVQFNLEGPKTLRCESPNKVVTVDSEKGPIRFEFNHGSCQLPCMKFEVLSGSTNRQ